MSTVAVERAGDAIRIIRLDRPDRLNAISFELVADLHDALDEVAGDETCKVVVLTGALGMAEGVAAYTGIGLRMTKEVMWANLDTPNMAACIALENRNQEIAGRSAEVQEHMRAYRGRVTS